MAKKTSFEGFDIHKSCCAILAFEESSCKIGFPADKKRWVCLSGTVYQKTHGYHAKLCDLLFAWDRAPTERVCCVVEAKSGGMSVSGVVQQLQAGAQIVDDWLSCAKVPFTPVLAHRGLATIQLDKLRQNKIQFRGKRYSIELMRCGESLMNRKFSL